MKHTGGRLIKFSFLIVVIVLAISCSSHKQEDILPKTVFKYNELGSITSLDPAAARSLESIWVDNQLYNGLVQMNDQLQVEPCIAWKWVISEDGRTYVFNLRNDVFFMRTTILVMEKDDKLLRRILCIVLTAF